MFPRNKSIELRFEMAFLMNESVKKKLKNSNANQNIKIPFCKHFFGTEKKIFPGQIFFLHK